MQVASTAAEQVCASRRPSAPAHQTSGRAHAPAEQRPRDALRKLALLGRLLGAFKIVTLAELFRLNFVKRYASTSTRLLGRTFLIPDAYSFIPMFADIFEYEIYKFHTGASRPLIIDCGANIGLSVLYFKKLFPTARVVAFEPDPLLVETLHANVRSFALSDVRIIPAAVWDRETGVDFHAEGGDAGRIVESGTEVDVVKVPAVRLQPYLNEPVALLKIDIEGAETTVLRDCAAHLNNVEHLFVEYHSFAGVRQTLDELLQILAQAGFRYEVHAVGGPSPHPFVGATVRSGLDMQLNIFAHRS